MDEDREKSIHDLLELGVPLSRVEEIYGVRDAHLAARSFVVQQCDLEEEPKSGRMEVAVALLQHSDAAKQKVLGDKELVKAILSILAEDPDESLMDPITMVPLTEPVVLSTGYVVDRSTVMDGDDNLRFTKCPFSRADLDKTVFPILSLRKKLLAYRIKRLQACYDTAQIFLDESRWDEAKQVVDTAQNFLDMQGDTQYFTIASKVVRLYRRLPGVAVGTVVTNYKQLYSRASVPERKKFLRNVAQEGLDEATTLIDSLSLKNRAAQDLDNDDQPSISDSQLWLALHPWLDQEENREAWDDLRLPLAKKLLHLAKLAKSSDIKRLTHQVWTLLENEEDRRIFLQKEGITKKEMTAIAIAPDFDTTGWRRTGGTATNDWKASWPKIPWLQPEQGRIRTGGLSSFIEFESDLSPHPGQDWTMEVAFKPISLFSESYRNSVFSQHGSEMGWELRTCPSAVELVFTTGGLGLWQSQNEFRARPISGVRVGEWTHCFVVYEHATKRLMIYIDGLFSASKHIQGEFIPATEFNPRLGQNPCWGERFFNGEVAFAKVDHRLPCHLMDLTSFVSDLADIRLAALEERSGIQQVMRKEPFRDTRHWRVRHNPQLTGEKITLDCRGGFCANNQYFCLQPTDPVSFTWKNGTVHTMHSFENGVITWTTGSPWLPTILWEKCDDSVDYNFGSFRDNTASYDDDDDDSIASDRQPLRNQLLSWQLGMDDDDL